MLIYTPAYRLHAVV